MPNSMMFNQHVLDEASKALVEMATKGEREHSLPGQLSSFKVLFSKEEPKNPIHLPIPMPEEIHVEGDAYIIYDP